MYLFKAGIVKFISFSFTVMWEVLTAALEIKSSISPQDRYSKGQQQCKLPHIVLPMFLNPVLKRSLLEVSGWKSLRPCSDCCQAVVPAGQAAGQRLTPCLEWTTGLEQIFSLCFVKRRGLDSLRLHYSAWLLSHFGISLWLDGTFASFFSFCTILFSETLSMLDVHLCNVACKSLNAVWYKCEPEKQPCVQEEL